MADPFPVSRRTKVLRIVLALSLALNLAVAGMAAGLLLRGHDGRPPRDFDMSLGPVARALSPADRAAIRDTLKARRDLGAPRRDRGSDLLALQEALTAEPYDAQALRSALTTPAARAARFQSAAAEALADRIDAMTPEDRQALSERLTRKPSPR